jgi:hypothetical protein
MIPVPGVYMIQHLTTQRAYIGSSRNVEQRCRHHVSALLEGRHTNAELQADWDHDSANFRIWLLEPLENNDATLNEAERRWCERFIAEGKTLYCRQIAGRQQPVRRRTLPRLQAIRSVGWPRRSIGQPADLMEPEQ